jgi:hypothetical protein
LPSSPFSDGALGGGENGRVRDLPTIPVARRPRKTAINGEKAVLRGFSGVDGPAVARRQPTTPPPPHPSGGVVVRLQRWLPTMDFPNNTAIPSLVAVLLFGGRPRPI